MHIGRWWSERAFPSAVWRLWSIRHIPWICHPRFLNEELFWEDNDSRVPRDSLQKWREHWQRYRKMVSRNASKRFTNVEKSMLLPIRNILKEMVNGCKATYFCVINQFPELFKATSLCACVYTYTYIYIYIIYIYIYTYYASRPCLDETLLP
jgi:hypothetical protein